MRYHVLFRSDCGWWVSANPFIYYGAAILTLGTKLSTARHVAHALEHARVKWTPVSASYFPIQVSIRRFDPFPLICGKYHSIHYVY